MAKSNPSWFGGGWGRRRRWRPQTQPPPSAPATSLLDRQRAAFMLTPTGQPSTAGFNPAPGAGGAGGAGGGMSREDWLANQQFLSRLTREEQAARDAGDTERQKMLEQMREDFEREQTAASQAFQREQTAFGYGPEARAYQAYLSDLDLKELDHKAALDDAFQIAKDNRDHQNQLAIMREQERIDKAAEDRGWERSQWLEASRQHHDFLMQEKEQGFTAQQNQLARENQTRLAALDAMSAIYQGIMRSKENAMALRGQLAGQDPLRASLSAQGILPVGPTPMSAYQEQLGNIVNAPYPAFNPNAPVGDMLSSVTGAMQQPTGLPQPPAVPGGFPGAAGGAEITMDNPEPDIGGSTGVGVLVGERGPEVMEVRSDGVRIIPLVQRGAGGLTVSTRSAGLTPSVQRSYALRQMARQAAPMVPRSVLRSEQRPYAEQALLAKQRGDYAEADRLLRLSAGSPRARPALRDAGAKPAIPKSFEGMNRSDLARVWGIGRSAQLWSTSTDDAVARLQRGERPTLQSAPGTTDYVKELIRLEFSLAGVDPAYAIHVAEGESSLNPGAQGGEGEQGLFQLLPGGLLDEFYRQGYTDPLDPWQNARFTANYVAQSKTWEPWHAAPAVTAQYGNPLYYPGMAGGGEVSLGPGNLGQVSFGGRHTRIRASSELGRMAARAAGPFAPERSQFGLPETPSRIERISRPRGLAASRLDAQTLIEKGGGGGAAPPPPRIPGVLPEPYAWLKELTSRPAALWNAADQTVALQLYQAGNPQFLQVATTLGDVIAYPTHRDAALATLQNILGTMTPPAPAPTPGPPVPPAPPPPAAEPFDVPAAQQWSNELLGRLIGPSMVAWQPEDAFQAQGYAQAALHANLPLVSQFFLSLADQILQVVSGTLPHADAYKAITAALSHLDWNAPGAAPTPGPPAPAPAPGPGPTPGPQPNQDFIANIQNAIRLIYRSLGLPESEAETALSQYGTREFRHPAGDIGQFLNTLGVRPQLFRDVSTGQIWAKDQGGQLHLVSAAGGITSVQQLVAQGYHADDVVDVTPQELGQVGTVRPAGEARTPEQLNFIDLLFGRWPPTEGDMRKATDLGLPNVASVISKFLGGSFSEQEARDKIAAERGAGIENARDVLNYGAPTSAFPPPPQMMIEPNTGLAFPNFGKIARLMRDLQQNDPATADIIFQAADLMGFMPRAQAQAWLSFYTPTGTFSATNPFRRG